MSPGAPLFLHMDLDETIDSVLTLHIETPQVGVAMSWPTREMNPRTAEKSMHRILLRIASTTLAGLAFAAVLLGCDQGAPPAPSPPAPPAPSVAIVQETPSAPQTAATQATVVPTPVPAPMFTPVQPAPTASVTPEPVVTQVAMETPTVRPTLSPTTVSAPSPPNTPVPSVEPTPAPTSTPIPSTPTPVPPTPTPTVDPSVPPHLRHMDQKRLMLELINVERTGAGLQPVAMGDNAAAQLHAEAALEGCFSSHWGLDGPEAVHEVQPRRWLPVQR